MRLRSVLVGILCCGTSFAAHADILHFTFGNASSPFSGAGTFTTGTMQAPGEFPITAVSGSARLTAAGQSVGITSVLSPGVFPTPTNGDNFPANDNIVFVFNGVGTLSQDGVSFLMADGSQVNLYNGGSGPNALLFTQSGGDVLENAPTLIAAITPTPEPTSLVFFGMGVLGLGFLTKRFRAAETGAVCTD